MPAPALPDELARQAGEAYLKYGPTEAARRLGISHSALEGRVRVALLRGFIRREDRRGGLSAPAKIADELRRMQARESDFARPEVDQDRAPDDGGHQVLRQFLAKPRTLGEIAVELQITRGRALDLLDGLREAGVNVHERGDLWVIDRAGPAPQRARGEIPTYESRDDDTYVFGFTADQHLCSKYSRLDVLESLYDHFVRIGVDRVFNAGNWIDGEARFNVHDLLVHGMQQQIAYLVDKYPSRPGMVTYAIAGDDHEGWYCQREGVDIGRLAANAMRDAGRDDWADLGYMEAYVRLVNRRTRQSTLLHVMHPGSDAVHAKEEAVGARRRRRLPADARPGHGGDHRLRDGVLPLHAYRGRQRTMGAPRHHHPY